MSNRLYLESSPYLLQHKDNPVHWYPWGTEALEQAQKENKPIFLSIGYAACHWCHVMERESFENEDIAAMLNEHFINIKVDREERPDVDAIYMNAIHLSGQGGGWPLSAFCTPEGFPFYLGTYFPPDDRYGRPGFPKVIAAVSKLFQERRDEVYENTQKLIEGLQFLDVQQHGAPGDKAELTEKSLVEAGQWLMQHVDHVNGGFGSKPKFPSPSTHALLARTSRLNDSSTVQKEAYLKQAMAMARGGLYDHLGGGFARYSVDARWEVPHFEKMLYDNAQLLGIMGDAYALSDEAYYPLVIEQTVGWLNRDMRHETGGLFASQDADSEGEEGKFYVWTPEEIQNALGEKNAQLFCNTYCVKGEGNFENNTSVLQRIGPVSDAKVEEKLKPLRQKLFSLRSTRIAPATDTKVLTGWNALTITGLVRAFQATGNQQALQLAKDVAAFLEKHLYDEAGPTIWRVWKNGQRKLEGTLDDYAFVTEAWMRLAEVTGESHWWEKATLLLKVITERFYDAQSGSAIFYMIPTESKDEFIHRPTSNNDSALPAGGAVAVDCLIALSMAADAPWALAVAEEYLASRLSNPRQTPFGSGRLLGALDRYLHGTTVVITEGAGHEALVEAFQRSYAPTAIRAGPWCGDEIWQGKEPAANGAAQAFVCKGQSCTAPITDPKALRSHLEGA